MMIFIIMIPMNVTLVGIVTDVRELQQEKAQSPYDSSYDDIQLHYSDVESNNNIDNNNNNNNKKNNNNNNNNNNKNHCHNDKNNKTGNKMKTIIKMIIIIIIISMKPIDVKEDPITTVDEVGQPK